jgi:hypothetical protein
MRPAVASAQRAAAVRQAVRSWVEARLVDETAAAAIRELVPDDRVRVGTAARVLFFFFTAVATLALFGWLSMLTDSFADSGVGWLALGFGVGLVVLTEELTGARRRAEAGAEEATAVLAVCFLFAAFERMLSGHGFLERPVVLAGVALVLSTLAAWRWGGVVFGGVAAAAGFVVLTGFPATRWTWIGLAASLFWSLVRGAESGRFPPGQRRALAAALAVAVVAGYAACHPEGIVSPWLVESVESSWQGSAAVPFPTVLARFCIVVIPLGLLLAGFLGRRRLLLDLGLLLVASSAVWFCHDSGIGPVWLLLLLAGGVCLALALSLRRVLASAPGQERWGCTGEAVLGDREAPATLEVAATLASLAPEARPLAGPQPAPTEGGGGTFGGGGASSSF